MKVLFVLFIVVPIVEMFVLIKVGSLIGALPTVALVLLTAVVGVALIRAQGFSTLRRAQVRMAHGEVPAQEMIDGLCLAVGGVMLLTPGFVTDTFGFLLLVPGVRKWMLQGLIARATIIGAAPGRSHTAGASPSDQGPQTLEGEYQREDPRDR